jgi:outer membrane protein assembly factor BamD (BamD/ComL family)
MSVSGISSSSVFNYSTQDLQNNMKQVQQEFQQLGQDLESGDLSAAQSDFATLQQLLPQNSSTSSTQSNSPIAQAFSQLSKDLQAGDLSAAQKDYTTIQQDFQNQAAKMQGINQSSSSGSGSSTISKLFEELGQALQSGDLSTAQSLFTSLQQQLRQLIQSSGLSSTQTSSQSRSSSISVLA